MTEWRTVPIRDLCLGIFDGPHATPKKTSSGPVFLGISSLDGGRLNLDESAHLSETDFTRWTRRVTPQPNDVVFSYETRLGEAAIIPEGLRCCLGRRMALMRPNPVKVDPRFLLYAYLGPEFQATIRERTVHGSTVERILLTDFPDFPIRVPDLPTQRSIAGLLGALDDKIELNRRMNRTLESIARAIFKSWFVDFDPVRKKMEGKTGGELGLPPSLAALFPNRLIESKLGELPEGWAVGCLGDVALQVRDTVRPEDIPKDLAYFGLEHLPRRSIALAEWSDASDIASSKSRFAKGDILFGKLRPYFHKVGPPPVEGVCSTDIVVVRPKSRVLASFVLGHVSSDEFVDHVSAASSGTRMPRTTWKDLAAYPIVIPSEDLCRAFDEMGRRIIDRIHSNILESRTASGVRDSLLPRLINGELLGGCGTGG